VTTKIVKEPNILNHLTPNFLPPLQGIIDLLNQRIDYLGAVIDLVRAPLRNGVGTAGHQTALGVVDPVAEANHDILVARYVQEVGLPALEAWRVMHCDPVAAFTMAHVPQALPKCYPIAIRQEEIHYQASIFRIQNKSSCNSVAYVSHSYQAKDLGDRASLSLGIGIEVVLKGLSDAGWPRKKCQVK